jgi:hypothetical protein
MTTMKLLARTWFVGTSIAMAALVAGCASDKPTAQAPPQKPAPQPVGLAQIKTELLESKAQIQTTTDALATLQKSPAADASANYNKFTEEYLKLQAKSDALKSRAQDLKAKTSSYYALWNKQVEVENPDLRRQAVQQKADAERVYNTVSSEMELARIAFNPYMGNLKDVGNYLRGNLSPASLQSVSDLAGKATAQAKQVNTHIDAIVAAIDNMAKATGEGAVPAAAAAPGAAAVPPAK